MRGNEAFMFWALVAAVRVLARDRELTAEYLAEARDEIDFIGRNTRWDALRARCASALAEFGKLRVAA